MSLNIGILSSAYNVEAQDFFNRVTAAGGTLSTTEQNAIRALVINLKSIGVWDKMKAIYPMVGSSAAACAQNLKSSSYTGTFTSGWTFASTGVTPNGTSAFFNTTLNLLTNTTIYNVHYSIYSRTDSTLGVDFGVTTSPLFQREGWMTLRNNLNELLGNFYDHDGAGGLGGFIRVTNTNSQGYYVLSAIASNNIFITKNSSVVGTSTTNNPSQPGNGNVYLGAFNNATTSLPFLFANRQYALATIGDGLTTTQSSNLYSIVQSFQTLLSRQV
jgi:hypothetical protein